MTTAEPMHDDDLTRRALAAWFRSGGTDQPSSSSSGAVQYAGKAYVVLQNVNGPLAVYRVRNDGKLKRLIRWPKELAPQTQ